VCLDRAATGQAGTITFHGVGFRQDLLRQSLLERAKSEKNQWSKPWKRAAVCYRFESHPQGCYSFFTEKVLH
jgi:hypothetical protein